MLVSRKKTRKNSIVVFGFNLDNKNQSNKTIIRLDNLLDPNITINDIHKLGKNADSPIIVEFKISIANKEDLEEQKILRKHVEESEPSTTRLESKALKLKSTENGTLPKNYRKEN
ncbi:hypothetical protein JTB14_009271 [Gonioctena quinquepunctata]|nr:hypothetical protein JTB14_009271 [Gonioctena quinquepunctata]